MESQSSQAIGAEVYCRICAAPNPMAVRYCQACWARLDAPLTTWQQADLLRRRLDWRKLRMRIFRLSMLAAALLAILYYTWDELNNSLVPLPLSRVEAATGPGQWAMSGGGVQHMSWVRESVPIAGDVLWKFQTEKGLSAPPVVVDGVVYLSTHDNQVVALSAPTGQLIWSHQTTGPVDVTPAVTVNMVYVGLRDGTFLALDREDGRPRWTFLAPTVISASPVVSQGVVYVGVGNGKLHALDAQTGEELWSFLAGRSGGGEKEGHRGEWITGMPVIYDDVIAVSSLNGSIHFVDRRTGLRRLRYDAVAPLLANTAYAGDKLVLTTELGRLIVLDSTKRDYPPEETIRRWRKQWFYWGLQKEPPIAKGFVWAAAGFVNFSTPAVTDSELYTVAEDGRLHCFDLATGELTWTYSAGTGSSGAPLIVDDVVYFGTDAGDIHAVDRQQGVQRDVFPVGGSIQSSPVVANETLFVISKDGALYAFK